MSAYEAFANEVVRSGIVTDPWLDGAPRLREKPVMLGAAEQRAMYRAAEDVAAVYHEMCLLVGEMPALLDDFFGLTAYQKAMWLASQPAWHGIARADVFVTDEGLAFAELNCDTPTGEAEAVVLGAIARERQPDTLDPNAELGDRFCRMVDAVAARTLEGARPRTVGLVYPTEFSEDLSLVRLYRRWFEDRGYDVVLGSPYNLTYDAGGPRLFDTPFSVLIRHYKTDWWGERVSAWDDEVLPDTRPLDGPLHAVLAGQIAGQCAVVNPLGAVLPQNKRAMAFMWEHLHRFTTRAQTVIQRYIPRTVRLERLHEEQLAAQKDEWVIKSDYGAEGDEVVVGRHTDEAAWRATIAHARPGRWIAQRYFQARTGEAGEVVNHGVYLIAGEACGLYARVQQGPTDVHALSAPVLVERGDNPRLQAPTSG